MTDAALALVASMAREADYQVWCEVVKSDDKTAVIIEDGRVKQPPMQEAAE